jgi:hypothetical protein
MIPTERVYMQFVPKVSGAIAEVQKVRRWVEAQKGIKRYCEENPEAYKETLRLFAEAEATLQRTVRVFMRGEPAVVK